LICAVLVLAVALSAAGLSPGDDLLVPGAARTAHWVTDLYLLNPGSHETTVTVYWLVRGRPNPDPSSFELTLSPEETRLIEDVVATGFGLERGTGALRITASSEIVATTRIYWSDGDGTVGQGFEGVPTAAATVAGTSTHALGLRVDEEFRSNVYALASAAGATIALELLDTSGSPRATAELVLGPWQPHLEPVGELFQVGDLDNATLLIRVTAGAAVVGASRVDNRTMDPTTLTSWVEGRGDPLAAGLHYGVVLADDTAAAAGLTLRVNGTGGVEALEFSYPSDRCPVLFTAGQDLSDQPLPLATLAEGYGFSSAYPGGGTMQWTLRLAATSTGFGLTGSLGASGSGWGGDLVACNGSHATWAVEVGMHP
jgi:hypothetical protein